MCKFYSIGIIFLFFLCGCPTMDNLDELPSDATLTINNNLNKDILFYDSHIFPDTSINIESSFFNEKQKEYAQVKSKSSRNYPSTWIKLFENKPLGYKLIIFFFDKTTVETLPWDTIKKNYMILKRYDLSLEDLERMNWTIKYP